MRCRRMYGVTSRDKRKAALTNRQPVRFGRETVQTSAMDSVGINGWRRAQATCFRAGGVQRNAAPNLFQTLIEATAEVR